MKFRGRERLRRWSDETPCTEQSKSIGTATGGFDTFQPGDRRVAVVNDHCMSGADLAQIGAEVVFQL
jgi:hypothetical protein